MSSDAKSPQSEISGEVAGTSDPAVDLFRPHPFVRGGHLQTLVAFALRSSGFPENAEQHKVLLPDGDTLVLHDDRPTAWKAGDRVVLLIHGLAGNHGSPYMQRIAVRLCGLGVRTFRLDLRGCGAGEKLARWPYHSGRSEDALAALSHIVALCPGSPIVLVGFSLGGNITLKLLGENPAAIPASLVRAMAVCPPIDLFECVKSLARGINRIYDRYFARMLNGQVAHRQRIVPDLVVPADWPRPLPLKRLPRGIAEFDDAFTAPVSGFGTATNYYRLCSSAQFIGAIDIPTLILAAADDPMIPPAPFERLTLPSSVQLLQTQHGGHLGYIGRQTGDSGGRWMDERVVEWCLADETRI